MQRFKRSISVLLLLVMMMLQVAPNLAMAESAEMTERTVYPTTITEPLNSITTSNKQIEISGTVEEECKVKIYKWDSNANFGEEDKVIAEVDTEDKKFKVTVELDGKSNSFAFSSYIDGVESVKSGRLYIYYEAVQGPKITVTSPSPYFPTYVDDDNMDIKGTVNSSRGVKEVFIKGEKAALTESDDINQGYYFLKNVNLEIGKNDIEIIAFDNEGNESKIIATVHRNQPEEPKIPEEPEEPDLDIFPVWF